MTTRFHEYLDTGPSEAHEYRAIGWWAYSQSWAFPLDPGPFYLSPSSSGPSSSHASQDLGPSGFRADGINNAAEARNVEKEFSLAKKYTAIKAGSKLRISNEKLKNHFEKHFTARGATDTT